MNMSRVKTWCKEKADNVKDSVDQKFWELGQWAKANPEQAATVAATAVGAFGVVLKGAVRGARLRKETKLKDRYIYDRSLGRYWTLRRKPTQAEQLQIERMKRAGLSYGEILTSLRLL